jgi:hypothetical protein
MTYVQRWLAISTWIRAIANIGSWNIPNSAGPFRSHHLAGQISSIVEEIRLFKHSFSTILPDQARYALEQFDTGPAEGGWMRIITIKPGDPVFLEQADAAIAILVSFDAKMAFYLLNHEHQIFSLTERAFTHLNRLLFVDEIVRNKWNKAFHAGGERKLEQ